MPVPTMAMGFSQPNIKSRRNRMNIAFSKSLPTKVQAATLAMLKTLCPWRRCDVIWGFSNFERDPSIYWYTWKLYTKRFLVQLETYYIYNFYLYSYMIDENKHLPIYLVRIVIICHWCSPTWWDFEVVCWTWQKYRATAPSYRHKKHPRSSCWF